MLDDNWTRPSLDTKFCQRIDGCGSKICDHDTGNSDARANAFGMKSGWTLAHEGTTLCMASMGPLMTMTGNHASTRQFHASRCTLAVGRGLLGFWGCSSKPQGLMGQGCHLFRGARCQAQLAQPLAMQLRGGAMHLSAICVRTAQGHEAGHKACGVCTVP